MDRLLAACEKKFPPEKIELLKKAIEFAKAVHADQVRETGDPYYTHPEEVALILVDMDMDADTVIAGLLHDTVEDGMDVTVEQVASMFGKDIAKMVDGVTKLTNTNITRMLSREDRQAENLRKMFLAIANDVRVVIIKLADRLHNMRTLEPCQQEKRIRKSQETIDIYAPLAERFGMGAIKGELEDIAFKYLLPDDFKDLHKQIDPKQEERMALLESAMHRIEDELKAAGIKCEVGGRRKHIYSIYRKLKNKNASLNDLYDLVALRVIVDSVKDCYGALGIIHSIWRPVPGRFKDYIAMPKTNMYRSLHTTLFSDFGMPFEVQIRTQEMHRMAEYGIAAHWMYKEGRSKQDDLDKKLEWLHQLVNYASDASTSKEYVENVRHDFFTDYVFVLTPQGEIFDLPVGSTPVDFAYRIHSNVGDHTHHAKVNGVPVKLDYKLRTHDVVEITTSPQASPNRDWLTFVKTSQAKNHIKQYFKKANRDENIARGKDMLAEAARRQGRKLSDITKPDYIAAVLTKLNMNEFDDVLAAIGYGGLSTGQVLSRLMEAYRKERKEQELAEKLASGENAQLKSFDAQGRAVIVKGEANMVVRFAQCCSPLPGEEIFGYITRGRGVSIHSAKCPNAASLRADTERIISVEWADENSTKFPVSIHILGDERPGLMAELTSMLLNLSVNLHKLSAKTTDDGRGVDVSMGFEVKNTEHLESITRSLMKIEGVREVTRALS